MARRVAEIEARAAFDAAVAGALAIWTPGDGPRQASEAWRAACNRAVDAGRALPWVSLGWLFGPSGRTQHQEGQSQ